jgi:hypothetical protein
MQARFKEELRPLQALQPRRQSYLLVSAFVVAIWVIPRRRLLLAGVPILGWGIDRLRSKWDASDPIVTTCGARWNWKRLVLPHREYPMLPV